MSYGWGDDSSTSRSSGGHDYSSARRVHQRTYTGDRSSSRSSSRSSGNTRSSRSYRTSYPLNKEISTKSKEALLFKVDVTGSMQTWPKIIFEKLPLLYNEVKIYKPRNEIAFGAIGDAYTDNYPIQVCDFGKEKKLDELLNSLFPEGLGGGQGKESYELMAYFLVNHCKVSKTKKKPLLIMTGDEAYYPEVNPAHVKKFIGDDLREPIDSKEVMKQLKDKFNVHMIRKTYEHDLNYDKVVEKQWKDTLGEDNVWDLEEPRRIVDTAIGIVAIGESEFENFSSRLSERQTEEQVNQVLKSLRMG